MAKNLKEEQDAARTKMLAQKILTEYPAPPLQNVLTPAPVSRRSAAGISWENPEYTSATGQRVFPIPIPIDRSNKVRAGIVPAVSAKPQNAIQPNVAQSSPYTEQIIGKDAPRIGLQNLTNINEYVPGNTVIPEANMRTNPATTAPVVAAGVGPQFNKDNQFVGSNEEFKRYIGNGNDAGGPTGIGYVETLDKKGRPTGMVRVENAKYNPDENPQLPNTMDPRALGAAVELYKANRGGGELTAYQQMMEASRQRDDNRAEKVDWDKRYAPSEINGEPVVPDIESGIINSILSGEDIPQSHSSAATAMKNNFKRWLDGPSPVKGKTQKQLMQEKGLNLDSPEVRMALLTRYSEERKAAKLAAETKGK